VKRLTATLLFATALLASVANAQQPPEVQPQAKKTSRPQVPPEPVMVPLSVGTAFNATLTTPLDALHAKSGDKIAAETSETVSYERCVIFPRGTKIIGHVVRASSPDQNAGGSALFVQFDKAILKNGQEVLMNAGIQAIFTGHKVPTPADTESYRSGELDARNRATNGSRVYPSGGALSAANPAGTVVELSGTSEPARKTTYRPPSYSLPTVQGGFTKQGLLTPDSQGALGSPDLKIYTPTSPGSDGTVILSTRENVRLESGTRLLLVIQPPPAADSN
jgi:hypothetical protein